MLIALLGRSACSDVRIIFAFKPWLMKNLNGCPKDRSLFSLYVFTNLRKKHLRKKSYYFILKLIALLRKVCMLSYSRQGEYVCLQTKTEKNIRIKESIFAYKFTIGIKGATKGWAELGKGSPVRAEEGCFYWGRFTCSPIRIKENIFFKPFFSLLLISFTLFTFPSASCWIFLR